jgi:hypothetical protein
MIGAGPRLSTGLIDPWTGRPELDLCAPDLAAVVATWPTLLEAIRAGILAMVKAAVGGADSR